MVKTSSAVKRKAAKALKSGEGEGASGGAKPTVATGLMEYIKQWSEDRPNWKYNKRMNLVALTTAFDASRCDKTTFRALLPYLVSVQGGARERLVQQVETIIADEDEDKHGGEAPDSVALAKKETVLKRAVMVKRQLEKETPSLQV